jgi:hypothetical protein
VSKGSQTTTTQTGPPGYISNAYQGLITNTNALANTPYTPYTGEGVAPVNPQQYSGIADINQYALSGVPLYQQAAGLLGGAAQPLNPTQIQNYYSPFQQNVIDTTQGQFDEMNRTALNNIQGNAAAQGALGGTGPDVAKAAYYGAVLPGQEQTIAGLENTGYGQAVNLAMQQYQQNPQSVAYGLGSAGTGMVNTALSGAGAVMGAGGLEQNTQQAVDQYLYNQYLAQMGYPFAVNQYAAGIDTAVGSGAGGQSTTTGPPPSMLASLFGLGTAAAGAYGAYQGGQNKTSAGGGRIKGYQSGGSPVMPYSGGPSYIPGVGGLTHGNMGPPKPPGAPSQQGGASSILGNASQLASMGKLGQGIGSGLGGLGGGSTDTALGTIGPGGVAADTTDFMGGVADLGASIDAIGAAMPEAVAGGDAAAALLPLALLQSGGRINYPGGLALPSKNRINLPMRSGMGMPSFVKGYQGGGSPEDAAVYGLGAAGIGPAAAYEQENPYAEVQHAVPDLASGSLLPPDVDPFDASVPMASRAGTDLAGAPVPQDNASAAIERQIRGGLSGAPSRALAFNDEQSGVGGGYQLPPRLPPSARPQIAPGQGGQGFLNMSPEFWSSLMTAGLGMMASAQPGVPAGVAIGRGALEGVGAYGSMKEKEANIEMQARKLDQQAQQEQDRIAMESRKYTEMTPYEKAQTALTQEQRNFPRIVQSWKDQYGVEHHIYGVPGPNGTWLDPTTKKPVQLPPEAGGSPVSSTPPAAAPTTPAPVAPSVPTSQAEPPQQVASLGAIPVPEGMTVGGQKVTPQMLASTPPPLRQRNEKALEGLTPDDQSLVKGLANYDLLPNQLAARSPQHRDLLLARAQQYDDQYKPALAANIQKAKYDWDNGKHSDVVRKFDTAIDHIELVKGLIANLNNRSSNTWNNLANRFQAEFGYAAPTNYDAASRLVAQEIVGATVGAQNALGDRDEVAANFSRNRAPGQQMGIINTYEGLMAGQLHNLERQYRNATHSDDFRDKYLSPAANNAFYGRGLGQQASDADRNWARTHPEVRQKFIQTFGVEP